MSSSFGAPSVEDPGGAALAPPSSADELSAQYNPTLQNNFGAPEQEQPKQRAAVRASATTTYQGKLVKYITDQQSGITIVKTNLYNLIDEFEDGLVAGFEIAVNNSKCIMEVILYGDNLETPFVVNNFTMNQLLAIGRGLTPGDVAIQPNLVSQDKMGTKDDLFPWLARFKDDTVADHLGYDDRQMVLRFTPSTYVPYKRVVVNIKNTDQVNSLTVASLTFVRIVYLSREVEGLPPSITNRGQFSSDLSNVELTETDQLKLKRKKLSNFSYEFNDNPVFVPVTPAPDEDEHSYFAETDEGDPVRDVAYNKDS